MNYHQLKLKIHTIDTVFPSIVLIKRILEKMNDPELSATELSGYIKNDQALVAKILKLSNSAFYGFSRRINTIRDAISLLGYNTIKSIVLSLSFRQMLEIFDVKKEFLDNFSKHSMMTAFLAEEMTASQLKNYDPDIAYLAGLLHDIGKLVLMQFEGKEYELLLQLSKKNTESLYAIERKNRDNTHEDVGGFLLDKWGLPVVYVNVVQKHHSSVPCEENPKTYEEIIQTSNRLAHFLNFGDSGNYESIELTEYEVQLLEKLRPAIDRIMAFVQEIWEA